MRRARGITLVELVVVIAISGIIAATVGMFILRPIQGYEAQTRRAQLVDAAEMALRRMQRDIRRALPNSIRIDATGRIIEMLNTVDGGRYRASPPGAPVNILHFGVPETDFDVLGTLQYFAEINTAADSVVINNQTTTGNQYNAYFGDNRAQLAGGTTATHINLSSTPTAKIFAASLASPSQRFHVINGPITYLCDVTGGSITRFSGYAIQAAQPTNPAAAPLSGATSGLLTQPVAACRFTYTPGTSTRAGLVTLDITVRDAASNEQVRLLHQVHVDNVP
jgi:MSHA biogenesis protein MshO